MSIIVNNFNYDRYVGAAIESALAQDYGSCEVIVVDDGSTDGSAAAIRRFGAAITPVFKTNGGQSSAFNAGFSASHGDIVIFLDADDALSPRAAGEVVRALRPGCCKVQYRLETIDAEGNSTGAVHPPAHIPLPQGDVSTTIEERGYYVTPVTTGNAYPRAVLETLFPVPDRFRIGADGYLNAACAYFGPVVSIDEALGSYRLHGGNLFAFSGGVDVKGLRARLRHDLERDDVIREFATRLGRGVREHPSRRQAWHMFNRLASLRADPAGHPFPADHRVSLAAIAVRDALRDPYVPTVVDKVVFITTTVGLAVLPRRRALQMMEWVLVTKPRPAWMRRIGQVARRVTAPQRAI